MKTHRRARASAAKCRLAFALFVVNSLFAAPLARASAPQAAAATPAGVERVTSVEGITEYRLKNGLRVLMFPDQTKQIPGPHARLGRGAGAQDRRPHARPDQRRHAPPHRPLPPRHHQVRRLRQSRCADEVAAGRRQWSEAVVKLVGFVTAFFILQCLSLGREKLTAETQRTQS